MGAVELHHIKREHKTAKCSRSIGGTDIRSTGTSSTLGLGWYVTPSSRRRSSAAEGTGSGASPSASVALSAVATGGAARTSSPTPPGVDTLPLNGANIVVSTPSSSTSSMSAAGDTGRSGEYSGLGGDAPRSCSNSRSEGGKGSGSFGVAARYTRRTLGGSGWTDVSSTGTVPAEHNSESLSEKLVSLVSPPSMRCSEDVGVLR